MEKEARVSVRAVVLRDVWSVCPMKSADSFPPFIGGALMHVAAFYFGTFRLPKDGSMVVQAACRAPEAAEHCGLACFICKEK